MSSNEFEQAFDRICSIIGKRTQCDVAEYFGVKQSSISDAKRRCSIPDSWLVTLVEREGVNPAWVRRGADPERLAQLSIVRGGPLEISLEDLIRAVTRQCGPVTVTL